MVVVAAVVASTAVAKATTTEHPILMTCTNEAHEEDAEATVATMTIPSEAFRAVLRLDEDSFPATCLAMEMAITIIIVTIRGVYWVPLRRVS